jgi:hypothetical protein
MSLGPKLVARSPACPVPSSLARYASFIAAGAAGEGVCENAVTDNIPNMPIRRENFNGLPQAVTLRNTYAKKLLRRSVFLAAQTNI